MRIVNWNVNSARTRVDRMTDFLQRHDVDVLAVQETKCTDAQFPYLAFEALGYEVAHYGLNQWNGVAIISRVGIDDVRTSFPGQPGFTKDPSAPQDVEARAIGALCGGVDIWSLYVPNGRELDHPHYTYKLCWLHALLEVGDTWLEQGRQIALVGDWNIAPYDHDVWDIKAFEGQTHVSQPEREAFFAFAQHGWDEVTRERVSQYTYWDYQKLRFPKNEGMRIDFIYASPQLAARVTAASIDRDERKGKGASDHVPVIIDLA